MSDLQVSWMLCLIKNEWETHFCRNNKGQVKLYIFNQKKVYTVPFLIGHALVQVKFRLKLHDNPFDGFVKKMSIAITDFIAWYVAIHLHYHLDDLCSLLF